MCVLYLEYFVELIYLFYLRDYFLNIELYAWAPFTNMD